MITLMPGDLIVAISCPAAETSTSQAAATSGRLRMASDSRVKGSFREGNFSPRVVVVLSMVSKDCVMRPTRALSS